MKSYFEIVKNYLLELGLTIVHSSDSDEIIVIKKESAGINNLVIGLAEPVVIFEQYICDIDTTKPTIAVELLKKNRDIVHGAFVLDSTGSKVIFRDTLQLENLDLNEVEGTINSLSLLLSEYTNEIIQFSKK